jgi:uncharacterized membrane protein YcaP (DUF421 family)
VPDWASMFEPAAPLLESFARGTITFLAPYILLRVVGQRESGALGMTDVLVVVAGLHGGADSLIDAITYRSPRLAGLLKARPRPLIASGQLNRRVMRREFMTDEEVRSQLRLHGIDDITQVEQAYIEPNGMISLIRRDRNETESVEPPDAV